MNTADCDSPVASRRRAFNGPSTLPRFTAAPACEKMSKA